VNIDYVIGIDPSLTGTAVCVMAKDGSYHMQSFTSTPAPTLASRFQRYRQLVENVTEFLPSGPQLIAIEGYSFMSQGGKQLDRIEYGGQLRYHLLNLQHVRRDGLPIEIPPASLKKFVADKGNAKKPDMRMAVYKRWKIDFANDDECDAYGLARMAGCIAGWWEPANEKQREALKAITKGAV